MYALLLWLSGWHSHCSAVVAGRFHSGAFPWTLSRLNQNRIKMWGAFKNSGIAMQEVGEMLYLAYVKNKARFADESELVAKSQRTKRELRSSGSISG